MFKLNLVAGLLLAVSAVSAQAGAITDRADIPGSTYTLDFESFGMLSSHGGDVMEVFSASNAYNFAGGSITSSKRFTIGQDSMDLGANGVWGQGKSFLAFDSESSMSLNIKFSGKATQGVAFDYNVFDLDPDASSTLKVRYYDAANNLIKGYNFGFTSFGSTAVNAAQTFGYVSDLANIDHVTITGTGVVIDNLTFAAAVPEPESYALLLAGLGIVGAVARRRAKSV